MSHNHSHTDSNVVGNTVDISATSREGASCVYKHHECNHQLLYCQVCDVVYCSQCGKEWKHATHECYPHVIREWRPLLPYEPYEPHFDRPYWDRLKITWIS